jgi:hypothetical protein
METAHVQPIFIHFPLHLRPWTWRLATIWRILRRFSFASSHPRMWLEREREILYRWVLVLLWGWTNPNVGPEFVAGMFFEPVTWLFKGQQCLVETKTSFILSSQLGCQHRWIELHWRSGAFGSEMISRPLLCSWASAVAFVSGSPNVRTFQEIRLWFPTCWYMLIYIYTHILIYIYILQIYIYIWYIYMLRYVDHVVFPSL